MTKPKDFVRYSIICICGEKSHSEWKDILYDDYEEYDHLPDVVRSEETKEEYDEYWSWKKSQDEPERISFQFSAEMFIEMLNGTWGKAMLVSQLRDVLNAYLRENNYVRINK